jgi:hypothetical protein
VGQDRFRAPQAADDRADDRFDGVGDLNVCLTWSTRTPTTSPWTPEASNASSRSVASSTSLVTGDSCSGGVQLPASDSAAGGGLAHRIDLTSTPATAGRLKETGCRCEALVAEVFLAAGNEGFAELGAPPRPRPCQPRLRCQIGLAVVLHDQIDEVASAP